MEYAATLEPKCHPTAVRKLNAGPPPVTFTPRLNPVAPDFDPLAPDADLPPVPEYKQYQEPLQRSPVFDQMHKLFTERIAYIDGAMGTMIQRYKLEVGNGHKAVCCSGSLLQHLACTSSNSHFMPPDCGHQQLLEGNVLQLCIPLCDRSFVTG